MKCSCDLENNVDFDGNVWSFIYMSFEDVTAFFLISVSCDYHREKRFKVK